MNVRDKILKQLPYSGVSTSVPAPSPEEISAALEEVIAGGGVTDRDSARIVAFAWYHGIESQAVLGLFRTRGTKQIVQQELGSYRGRLAGLPAKIPNYAFRLLGGFMLPKELGLPELGWAIAILTVAEAADLGAIVECLGPQDDPSRIASFFIATPRFIPPQERRILIAKLLTLGDPTSLEAAIALFSWWIEVGVERGDMEIEGVFAEIEQNAIAGAVLLSSALSWSQRYQSPLISKEVAERAAEMERRIDEAGKKVFSNSKTVNKALKAEGIRYLDVLSAMSRWRGDPAFPPAGSKAIGSTVAQLLDRQFLSRQNLSIDGGAMLPRVSQWSIEPLVQIALHDGIDIDVFQNYFSGLATDSFSQLTRHQTFLEDRQRGIALVAVAGLVAYERVDAPLLEAVRNAASQLFLQPAGVVEVVAAPKRQEFAEKCGFILPEK